MLRGLGLEEEEYEFVMEVGEKEYSTRSCECSHLGFCCKIESQKDCQEPVLGRKKERVRALTPLSLGCKKGLTASVSAIGIR